MRLSLCMIVKDEAATLPHCLESVRTLVDEAIVVDTGSTDGTPDLARSLGAQVFHHPWDGDFSAARNASLAQAAGDWILVLDADEAIEARDHGLIRETCAREALPAWRPLIRNYLADGSRTGLEVAAQPNPGGYVEGSAFAQCVDSRMLRLFRRLPGVRYEGRVHELVDPFFEGLGHPVRDHGAVIHHYGQTFPHRLEAKKAFYLDLARRDLVGHEGDLTRIRNLVQQATVAEAWGECLKAVLDFEAEAVRQGVPVHPSIRFAHGWALQKLGRHPEAVEAFDRLLAEDPGHRSGLMLRGLSLIPLGRVEEAREAWRTCLREGHAVPYASFLLGQVEAGLGNREEARRVVLGGLEASPADTQLWNLLIKLDMDSSQAEIAAGDAWRAIQNCPRGGEGQWHLLVGLALLRQGAAEQGAAILKLGSDTFPAHGELARLAAKYG
jgi:tetratricopeptide (TPR) repeat protein